MSKRQQIQKHLDALHDINGIMAAMKNIAVMETHKLARFLSHQHRAQESIQLAVVDFLSHNTEVVSKTQASPRPHIAVVMGSQRGFCGDFNESLAQGLHEQWSRETSSPTQAILIGHRLAMKVGKDSRIAAAFDGPSVVEEVPSVLLNVMNTLSDLQKRAEANELLNISLLAHSEGQRKTSLRSILPPPRPATRANIQNCYPPQLNVKPMAFFRELTRHYLWAQMHDAFYSSLMAENRRRLQHMEMAMQRTEERMSELNRKCNLLRQEEITEEIEVIMLSSNLT